jgi:hypothetical protein
MDEREELAGLSALEQEVLAALALVGEAAVTPDELAGLAGVDDVGWALAELVRRGLVRVDDEDRAQALPAWRKALAVADRSQAILERAVELAEHGRLSPETLLGLTAWALRAGRYREALAVVRAAQEALAIVRRVEAWTELLERAATAARALGDREAEEWAARRLAASHELAGTALRRQAGTSALARRVLTAAAVAAAGAAGLVVGLVALDGPDSARADAEAVTTALVTQQQTVVETVVGTVTVAVPTTVTVTDPGPVETVTETETETVTTMVTVTVEPPPPPPSISR